jgi:hypothetical protein
LDVHDKFLFFLFNFSCLCLLKITVMTSQLIRLLQRTPENLNFCLALCMAYFLDKDGGS